MSCLSLQERAQNSKYNEQVYADKPWEKKNEKSNKQEKVEKIFKMV